MHLLVGEPDAIEVRETAPLGSRLGALLLERQAAVDSTPPAGGVPPAGAGQRASYLAAASIAAGLIIAWAGLCVI